MCLCVSLGVHLCVVSRCPVFSSLTLYIFLLRQKSLPEPRVFSCQGWKCASLNNPLISSLLELDK